MLAVDAEARAADRRSASPPLVTATDEIGRAVGWHHRRAPDPLLQAEPPGRPNRIEQVRDGAALRLVQGGIDRDGYGVHLPVPTAPHTGTHRCRTYAHHPQIRYRHA